MTPEQIEERAITALFQAVGGTLWALSGNAREGGTRQARGLPDFWFTFPSVRVAGWFDVKSPEGLKKHERMLTLRAPLPTWTPKSSQRRDWRRAHDQHAFQQAAKRCGVTSIIGTQDDARVLLLELGLARSGPGGHLILTPQRAA